MSTTRRALLDRREQIARRKDFEKQHLVRAVVADINFRNNNASDTRVENLRKVRESQIRQEQERRARAQAEHEQERQLRIQQLCVDAERLKRDEDRRLANQREERFRQAICENSHELRELEQKLNDAFTSKERALQMHEKFLEQERQRAQELELTEQLNKQLGEARQMELEKSRERHENQLQYKADLHEQLEDRERRKQAEYEQFLREKAMVDEIVRLIHEEDQREAMRRLEKQREAKQYIEDFMDQRREWNEHERQKTEAENRKIEEYAKLQKAREAQAQAKKKSQDTARLAIYDKLAAEMEEQERAKAELEELRIELYREEQEEAERQKEIQKLQSRIRKRLELIDAYQQQMQQKREKMLKEREEEDVFREKMMRKFAEDERLEQLNDHKRRMRQLEHRRAVEQLVEDRRRFVEQERLEELEIERRQKEIEDYKKAVVEQERQRLLREHAAKLIGYLPRGVLRDQRDLDLFDEDFRKRFESPPQHAHEVF